MIRPFGFRDLLLVKDLQRRGTILDLESALLGEYPSLRLALMAYLFYPAAGALTCVLDATGGQRSKRGFVQVRHRSGCPEWDVICLAPALDMFEGALTIWHKLLTGITPIAAEEGVLRVFARPVRDDLMESVLGQAGFSVYARERIHRLGAASIPTQRRVGSWRPADEGDREELYCFHRNVTPHLVRQAEGGHSQGGNGSLFGQVGFPGEERYVVSSDRLEAYLGLREGTKGYWVHLLLAQDGSCDPASLVSEGLSLLAGRPPLPVYWAVRDYQAGLGIVLECEGFEPLATRSLMVKHIAVRVKVNKHKLVPGLDKGVKAAPGMSPSGKSARGLEKRM